MNIHIKNGHVVDPNNKLDTQLDVFIAHGKIAALGKAPADFKADEIIDATDLIVAPGLVDLSARLREPGEEYKATLTSELHAAVAGGITSLACPPDTDPVLDEPGLVEMLQYRAKQLNLTHVYPMGALTVQLQGNALSEMVELSRAGCVGFTQADNPIIDTQVLWRAMEYAATFGFTLFLRPEEPYLAAGGVVHEGEVATRLGLKGIPAAAESLAIASLLKIAQETNAKIHLCRLSTAEGVELVRQAKQKGQVVTADVAAHQLHLTDMDIGFFNALTHVKPPLRGLRDKDALCAGVLDGTIDAICSDHTPVDDDAKLLPFAQSEAGATGLELLLPLTLKWATANEASLVDVVTRISSAPARIMGLINTGLKIDSPADICIFNPNTYTKISVNHLKSHGKNTPFLGLELAGTVYYTLIDGQIRYKK